MGKRTAPFHAYWGAPGFDILPRNRWTSYFHLGWFAPPVGHFASPKGNLPPTGTEQSFDTLTDHLTRGSQNGHQSQPREAVPVLDVTAQTQLHGSPKVSYWEGRGQWPVTSKATGAASRKRLRTAALNLYELSEGWGYFEKEKEAEERLADLSRAPFSKLGGLDVFLFSLLFYFLYEGRGNAQTLFHFCMQLGTENRRVCPYAGEPLALFAASLRRSRPVVMMDDVVGRQWRFSGNGKSEGGRERGWWRTRRGTWCPKHLSSPLFSFNQEVVEAGRWVFCHWEPSAARGASSTAGVLLRFSVRTIEEPS